MTFLNKVKAFYETTATRKIKVAKDLDLSNSAKALEWAIENISDLDYEDDNDDDNDDDYYKEATRQQVDDRVSLYVGKFREVMKKPHVTVYRAICVKKRGDINFKNLGIWWSFEEDGASCYGTDSSGKEKVTITAEVAPKHIDWETGFYSFVLYGEDQWECSLNEGSPVKVTHIDDEKLDAPMKATV